MIFVVGNSRSGTTLIGRILDRHPDIYTFQEIHFFEELWDPRADTEALDQEEAVRLMATLMDVEREGYLARRKPARYADEARERLAAVSDKGWSAPDVFAAVLAYEAARHGARLPCDKTPRNIFYLKDILHLYPDARIIEMVRDPRDVLLSQKNRWRRRYLSGGSHTRSSAIRSWVNYHPAITPRIWRGAVRAGNKYKYDERVFRVRFESLVADPVNVVRSVCGFLGVDFMEEMLGVPHVGSSSVRDSNRIGLNSSAIGRWRNGGLTNTEIHWCEKIAASEMKDLGYDSLDPGWNLFTYIGYLALLPVKAAFAFVVNIRRASSIFSALYRRLN